MVAKEFGVSPPGDVAPLRRAPPPRVAEPRTVGAGGRSLVGELWLRTCGGPAEPGHGSLGGSHKSELDLALLVGDFLEGGSGDSRGSSDSESGVSDLAQLADKISCAAGHLICSCHDNLPDKNKCVSCFVTYFISMSYSCCHAVEGILQSVRVSCPNAVNGCTAGKMPRHEMAEHENKCSFKAVLQQKASVLKMGPCGGSDCSKNWEMDVVGVDRILKVVIWHSDTVDAMSVLYEQNGKEKRTDPLWGDHTERESTQRTYSREVVLRRCHTRLLQPSSGTVKLAMKSYKTHCVISFIGDP